MERYTRLAQLLPFIFGGLLIILIFVLAFNMQDEKEVKGEDSMFSDLVNLFRGSEVVEETFSKSVPVRAETAMNISHSHGNVTVRGWNKDEVRIEGRKIVRAVDEETARMYAEMMEVGIDTEGDTIAVRTIRPKRNEEWKIGQISINYELYAPNRLKVALKNLHGDVHVEGFAGELHLDTLHSNLYVTQIGGTISVKHAHGDAELSGIGGDALVDMKHCKINITSVGGELRLNHEHGDVELSMIGKGAILHKEHGNLSAANVGGVLELYHQHGNIRLKMIEDSVRIEKKHGSIDVETVKGNLTIDSQHTPLRIIDIDGDIHLYGQHGNAFIENVSGSVDFSRSHSKAEYANVRGDILE